MGWGVPRWVEHDFRSYLRCGILAHGFARVRCTDCGHDRLLAFSCKGRGVCPSCNARRMAEVAAHLTDEVIPLLSVGLVRSCEHDDRCSGRSMEQTRLHSHGERSDASGIDQPVHVLRIARQDPIAWLGEHGDMGVHHVLGTRGPEELTDAASTVCL